MPKHISNTAFDIIAIAASAGGLKALTQLLPALPSNFPAAIVVGQHLAPQYRSLMASILG
jgi:two-component system chemotaxis response regulator CheB